jgi:hypothetical protein
MVNTCSEVQWGEVGSAVGCSGVCGEEEEEEEEEVGGGGS